jgi:hypothetical protein
MHLLSTTCAMMDPALLPTAPHWHCYHRLLLLNSALYVHVFCRLQECQGRSAGPAAAAAAAAPLQAVAGPSSSSGSSQQVLLQHRHGQQRPFHVPHAREDAADDDESSTPAITFKLLMKKAGKDDRSRELHVSIILVLWV